MQSEVGVLGTLCIDALEAEAVIKIRVQIDHHVANCLSAMIHPRDKGGWLPHLRRSGSAQIAELISERQGSGEGQKLPQRSFELISRHAGVNPQLLGSPQT